MIPRFAARIMRAANFERSALPVLSVASFLALDKCARGTQGCLIRISYRLMRLLQANAEKQSFARGALAKRAVQSLSG
jgi:hypothetical protein